MVTLGIWAIREISARAEAIFGPASPSLEPVQKLLLSWRLIQAADQLTSSVDPFGSENPFSISSGEFPVSVAQHLQEAGLISDADAFLDFLVYAGLDTKIQMGHYQLSPASSALEIAYTLLDATPSEVTFVVLPGWRLEEIAEALPTSGLNISPEIFLAEARQRNLEGNLLPGAHTVPRITSAKGLLDLLNAAFEEALTSEIRSGFANQGLSVDEAVRLAAIVEREAVIDNERTLIASVFLNRLAVNMKLEADPTVQYARGYNQAQGTWWTNPLSADDLNFDSPYNTYLFTGLPPGPICNPSLDSLRAVAFPAQTPYYYFRAACDGSGEHKFAETYEDHVENACP